MLALPAGATTVLRVVPPRDDATALLASFVPYGVVGYLLALVILLIALIRARRRRLLAILSRLVAALTALHLSWLGPFFVADGRPAADATFTVLTLNLYNGAADPAQVREQAAQVDVVVLVETTPDSLDRLATRTVAGALSPTPWAVPRPTSRTPPSTRASLSVTAS